MGEIAGVIAAIFGLYPMKWNYLISGRFGDCCPQGGIKIQPKNRKRSGLEIYARFQMGKKSGICPAAQRKRKIGTQIPIILNIDT